MLEQEFHIPGDRFGISWLETDVLLVNREGFGSLILVAVDAGSRFLRDGFDDRRLPAELNPVHREECPTENAQGNEHHEQPLQVEGATHGEPRWRVRVGSCQLFAVSYTSRGQD